MHGLVEEAVGRASRAKLCGQVIELRRVQPGDKEVTAKGQRMYPALVCPVRRLWGSADIRAVLSSRVAVMGVIGGPHAAGRVVAAYLVGENTGSVP